jgi:molybdopterin-guanine dinucleotide biosynthesis protein A
LIGAVLSGGENKRIPVLKGFLEVEGRAIIQRSIDVLARVFGSVVISTNMPERYFSLGVPLIGDIRKEKGPMTGILSVLVATRAEAVFVVACDMPFINEKLIRYMVGKHRTACSERGGGICDAVIPEFRSYKEPLFGIYTGSAVQRMESLIRDGRRKLTDVLAHLRVTYIAEQEVRAVDPEGESFVNINTMEDYERIGGRICLV